jgi:hypothetical protein
MNSIHRVGATIAGAVAILTVAGALLVEGYMSTRTAAAGPTASQIVATGSPIDATTATRTSSPRSSTSSRSRPRPS